MVKWYWTGKPKYPENTISQCHYVHNNSHINWPGIEPGFPGDRPATNCLCFPVQHSPTGLSKWLECVLREVEPPTLYTAWLPRSQISAWRFRRHARELLLPPSCIAVNFPPAYSRSSLRNKTQNAASQACVTSSQLNNRRIRNAARLYF